MKGVILAGGTGTRLHPLTRITNKHLLPVYDRPMIYYAIEALASAGVDRIMIVTGGNQAGDFLRLLGSGSAFGLQHLDYAYQEHAGGIGGALGLAEFFAAGEPLVVLLGDNVFEFSIARFVQRFGQQREGARLVLAEVERPEAYGVGVFDNGRLVRIVEKPQMPPSRYAVTGLYMYDSRVFEFLRTLVPSERGELEITDVNNRYLELGAAEHDLVPGYWADCGESVDGLFRATQLVATRGANKPIND